MQSIESAAFRRGVSASDLMDTAGLAIADEIRRFFPRPGKIIVFCGKGNNAGDVLVAARHLAGHGWTIALDLAFPRDALAELPARHLALLRDEQCLTSAIAAPPDPDGPRVALDGLLGIGSTGAPREPIAAAIRRLNGLRTSSHAFVVAADLPSGLDGDTGQPADPCVTADLTVTIAYPKAGLVADAATSFVGRLAVAELPELRTNPDSKIDPAELLTPSLLRPLLRPYPFDSHKGTWGRVGIIASSRGLLGAGRLASAAAVHSGAGLVTLYALPETYDLLATSCIPEVMVKPVQSFTDVLNDNLDALAIGPGLGSAHDAEILEILRRSSLPAVIDADALNCLARHPEFLRDEISARAHQLLLTPHPGEFARLAPDLANLPRRKAATQFVERTPVTLLLKGARTVITNRNHAPRFNSTGNPGMGSGGMGDVLTGVCAALLARHHSPTDAASLAAWLCGRAAEIAITGHDSPESLAASAVVCSLGRAFEKLKTETLKC